MSTEGRVLALPEPSATGLLVIDVQNDFCAKGGYFDRTGADLSLIDPAISRLADLLETARWAGASVIFVRSNYDPVYLSRVQNERRQRVGWDIPLCREGTLGVEFYRIAPRPDEVIVTKHRYDAFYGTDLELLLRTREIRTLLFTGVATNVCVESSLRSAFMRDFESVVVADCTAARSIEVHESALHNIRTHFGIVASSAEVERIWRNESTLQKAAG